jgi:hypothetical protein
MGEMNWQWYLFAVDTSGPLLPPMHTRPSISTGVHYTKGAKNAAKAISRFLDDIAD